MAQNENVIINDDELNLIIKNFNNLEETFDKNNDVLDIIKSISKNKEEVLSLIIKSNDLIGNESFTKDFILEEIKKYIKEQNLNKKQRINLSVEDKDETIDNNDDNNEEVDNDIYNNDENNYDNNYDDDNDIYNNDENISDDENINKYSFTQLKFKDPVTDYNYINKKELEYQEKFGESFTVSYDGSLLTLTEKLDSNLDLDFKSISEIKLKLTKLESENVAKEFVNPKYKIFLTDIEELNQEQLKELTDKLLESEIIMTSLSNTSPFYIEVCTKDIRNIDLTKKELENKKELEKNFIIKEIEKIKSNSQTVSNLIKNTKVKIIPNEKDLKNNEDEMKLSDFRLKTFSLFENLDDSYVGSDIIDNLSFFVSSYGDIDLNRILSKIKMPYYVEEAKKDLHLRGRESPQDKNKIEITKFINDSSLNITYRTEDNVKIIKRIKFLLNQEIEKIENKSPENRNDKDEAIINSHKKSLQDLNDSIQSFYVNRRTREVSNVLMTSLKLEEDKNVLKNEINENSFSFTNKEVIENTISINLKNVFNSIKKYKTNFDGEVSAVTKRSFNNIYEILKNHYTSIPNENEKYDIEKMIFKNMYLYLNISYTDNDLNMTSLQNKVLILSQTNMQNENNSEIRFKKLKNIESIKNFKERTNVSELNNLISNTDNYEILIMRLIELSSSKEEKEHLTANLAEFKEIKNNIINTPNYNPKNLILLNQINIKKLKETEVFKRIEQLDKQKIEAYKSGNFIKSSNMLIFQETVKNMHKILNENLLKEVNLLTLGGTGDLKLKINEMVRNSFQADREQLLRKIVNELISSNKDVITQNLQIDELYSEYRKGGFKVPKGDSFIYQQIAIDILDNFEKNFSFISDSAVNIVEKAFDENSKFSKSAFDSLNKEEKEKIYTETGFKEKINDVISDLNVNQRNLSIDNFNKALKLKNGESFEVLLSEKVGNFFSSISEKDNDISASSIKNVIISEMSLMEKNLMSSEEIIEERKKLSEQLDKQNILLLKKEEEIKKLEEIKRNTPDDLINLNNLKKLNAELKIIEDSKTKIVNLLLENSKINDVKQIFEMLNNGDLIKEKKEKKELKEQNRAINDVFDLALNNIVFVDKNTNNFEEIENKLKEIMNNHKLLNTNISNEVLKVFQILQDSPENKEKILLDFQNSLMKIKTKNTVKIENLNNKIELKEDFLNSLTNKTEVMLNKFKINQIINEDNISNILFADNEVKKSIQENLGLTPETVKIIYDGFKNNLFDNDGNNLLQNEIKNKLHFKDLVQEYKKERKESIKEKINGLEKTIEEIKESNRTKIGNLSHIIIDNEIKNPKSLISKMYSSFRAKYKDDNVTEEELKYKFISFLENKDMLKLNNFIKLEKINLLKSTEVNKNKIFNDFIMKTLENGDTKNLDRNLDVLFEKEGINKKDQKEIRKKIQNLIFNGAVAHNSKISYTINNEELLRGVNGRESNLLNDFKEVFKKNKKFLSIEDIDFIITNLNFIKKMNINELSDKNYNNFNELSLVLTENIERFSNNELKERSKISGLDKTSQIFKQLKVSQTLNLYKEVVSSPNYNFNLLKNDSNNQKNLKDVFERQKSENIENILNNMFSNEKSEDIEIINRINHIFECTKNEEYNEYSKQKNGVANKEVFINNMTSYINNSSRSEKEKFLKNLRKMDSQSEKQLSTIFNNISSVDSIVSYLTTDKIKLKSFLDNYISDFNILNNLSTDVLMDLTPSLLKDSQNEMKNKVDLTVTPLNNKKNIINEQKNIGKYIESYIEKILIHKGLDKDIKPTRQQKQELIDFIYSNNNDFSLFKNIILKDQKTNVDFFITLNTKDMMDDFVQNSPNKTFESYGNSINKRNNLREIEIETKKLQEKYGISPKFDLSIFFNKDNNDFDFENNNNFVLFKKMLSLETKGLSFGKSTISGEEISIISSFGELENILKSKNFEGDTQNLLKKEFSSVLSGGKKDVEDYDVIVKNIKLNNVDKYITNILNTNKKDKNLNILVNEENEISFVNQEGIPILDGIVSEDLINTDLVNITKAVLYNSKSVETFAKDKIPKNMEQLDKALEESRNIFAIDKKYNTKETHTFDKISSQKDKLLKQIENLENLEKTMFEEEKIRLFLYNEKDGTKEIGEDGEHKYVDYKISSLFSGESNDILNNMSQFSSLKGMDSIDTTVEEILEREGYTFEKGSREYTKQYMRVFELELNKIDTTSLFKKRKLFPEEVFENQLKIKTEINGVSKEIDLQEVLKGYKHKYINLKKEILEKQSKLIIFNKVEEQFQNPKEDLKKAFGELKPHWGEAQPKKNMFKKLLMKVNDFLPKDLKDEMKADFENSFTPEKEKEFLRKYGKKLNIGSTNPTYDDLFNAILDQKLELFSEVDMETSPCLDALSDLMKDFQHDTKNNKRIAEVQEKIKEKVKKGKEYTWGQTKDFGDNIFKDAGRALLMGF